MLYSLFNFHWNANVFVTELGAFDFVNWSLGFVETLYVLGALDGVASSKVRRFAVSFRQFWWTLFNLSWNYWDKNASYNYEIGTIYIYCHYFSLEPRIYVEIYIPVLLAKSYLQQEYAFLTNLICWYRFPSLLDTFALFQSPKVVSQEN